MNKLFSITLLIAIISLMSCSKQKNIVEQLSENAPNAVSFGSSNNDAIVDVVEASLPQLDQAINVFITGQTYGSDVTATVSVDQSIVDDYNTNNGTAYEVIPSDAYTAPSSISIPANSHEGTGTISVDIPTMLQYGTEFAIGLSLQSVSGGPTTILTAHSKIFILVKIKNPYDGDYSVKGYVFHPSVPRSESATKSLTTITAVTSEGAIGDLGGSAYYFDFDVAESNLTNWVAVGACPPAPQSGFMTADNPGNIDYSVALPDYPGVAPWLQSTYNNTYDESTGTFYMHYGYGVGASDENGFTRQFYEIWVKK